MGRVNDSVKYFERACQCSSLEAFPPTERFKFSIRIRAYEKGQGILNGLKVRVPAYNSVRTNIDQRITSA